MSVLAGDVVSMQGYTVGDAARRLDCSEATVRRQLEDDGPLEAIVGTRPLRVTRESVDREVQRKLNAMGVMPTGPTEGEAVLQMRIVELEGEVARLKGALFDLSTAHESVMNTYRRMTDGVIPNN
jgi:transposase-like protein